MRQLLRAKFMPPVVIVLFAITLAVSLAVRSHDAPAGPRDGSAQAVAPTAGGVAADDTAAGDSKDGLEAWQRPTTTDPMVFATAYARAIWTYDTTLHSFWTWQDAVSVFADPMDPPDGPRIAKSMLPYSEQFQQLELHKGKASVSDITAVVTPELKALEKDPRAPAGWHGYLVRATQTSVLDGQASSASRQATVAVVCTPRCKFWSASSQSPQ
jgi:hypothetical protein